MKIIISAFYFVYQTCTVHVHAYTGILVFNPFAEAIFSLVHPFSGSSCK